MLLELEGYLNRPLLGCCTTWTFDGRQRNRLASFHPEGMLRSSDQMFRQKEGLGCNIWTAVFINIIAV